MHPGSQRQLRRVKDGVAGKRGLATTAIALEFSFSMKLAETAGATIRALEAIWPAPGEQGVLTLIFIAVISQKLHNANAFLELNGIFTHQFYLQNT